MPTQKRKVPRPVSMPPEVWDWFDAQAAPIGLKGPQLVRQAALEWMRERQRERELVQVGGAPERA